MKRYFLVPVFGVLALAMASPASAQWSRRDSRYEHSTEPHAAYDRGFSEGVKEGEKDGRSRDRFDYHDERDFQGADVGYTPRYGNISRYREVFRQGFADGYADGYRRYVRGYGSYGPYGNGRGPYAYPGYPGGGVRYSSPFDTGARDGYEKGREDARDNDRYDPRHHKWYREGDRDYDNRYGSRERYKDEYRRGFLVGYERGYREGRR